MDLQEGRMRILDRLDFEDLMSSAEPALRYVLVTHPGLEEPFARTAERTEDLMRRLLTRKGGPLEGRLDAKPGESAHERLERERLSADLLEAAKELIPAYAFRESARLEEEAARMAARAADLRRLSR